MEQKIALITTKEDKKVISYAINSDNKDLSAIFHYIIIWEEPRDVAGLHEVSNAEWIIIAVNDPSVRKFIKAFLNCDDKIIDFWDIRKAEIPVMRADRVFANPKHSSYEGILLGLSHSEVGIITDLMDVRTAALSVSSQDVYYNFETLKYVFSKYHRKLKDLKYLFFDLYTYTYFNIDTSLTSHALNYYCLWGGYNLDPHNFNDNVNYEFDYGILMDGLAASIYGEMNNEKIDIYKKIFSESFSYYDFKEFSLDECIQRRNKIVNEGSDELNRLFEKEHYPKTIKENISAMESLLAYVRELNPHIRIIFFNMPVYLAQNSSFELIDRWKNEFYDIIDRLKMKYQFEYYDFTAHEMSGYDFYFNDINHFNYYGAIKFTQFFNDFLKR